MYNNKKNIYKISLIIGLLLCLVFLFFAFYFYKNKTKSLTVNKNINIEENTSSDQNPGNKPVLLSDEQKKKYGVETDKPVYLEMIEGNDDLPGLLPRLILPPEVLNSSSSEININIDSDKDGVSDIDESKK